VARRIETLAGRLGSARRSGVERGEGAAIWLVLVTVALVALAGLVFDGGRAVAARGEAMSIAQQAARSGADAVSAGSLHGGVDPAVGVAAAETAAWAVLDAAGVQPGDAAVTATAASVTVTVTVTRRTAILSIVGKDTLSGTATATAQPVTAGN